MSRLDAAATLAMHKCPCGHPVCRQYTLTGQGSVGFDEDDAKAIVHRFNSHDALVAALKEMHNQLRTALLEGCFRNLPSDRRNMISAAIVGAEKALDHGPQTGETT